MSKWKITFEHEDDELEKTVISVSGSAEHNDGCVEELRRVAMQFARILGAIESLGITVGAPTAKEIKSDLCEEIDATWRYHGEDEEES